MDPDRGECSPWVAAGVDDHPVFPGRRDVLLADGTAASRYDLDGDRGGCIRGLLLVARGARARMGERFSQARCAMGLAGPSDQRDQGPRASVTTPRYASPDCQAIDRHRHPRKIRPRRHPLRDRLQSNQRFGPSPFCPAIPRAISNSPPRNAKTRNQERHNFRRPIRPLRSKSLRNPLSGDGRISRFWIDCLETAEHRNGPDAPRESYAERASNPSLLALPLPSVFGLRTSSDWLLPDVTAASLARRV